MGRGSFLSFKDLAVSLLLEAGPAFVLSDAGPHGDRGKPGARFRVGATFYD